MNSIYTVSAQSLVGEEDVVETFEGKFAKPKETEKGQKLQNQNPEQLLAAAHAYCFSLTMAYNAKTKGLDLSHCPIKTTVDLAMDPGKGYKLMSGVEITVPEGTDLALVGELMKKTHNTCPVSKLVGDSNLTYLRVNGKDVH
ncbi:OsmC family protein [[Mycoplasma] testudinis]|uniref:OsmC family protein n=1 Tax=[Mycoplasma] testudinis TaxID=33924 RepID=UPI000481DF20|nr:OsmC family protein [[Mycoplasma] testudinis]